MELCKIMKKGNLLKINILNNETKALFGFFGLHIENIDNLI